MLFQLKQMPPSSHFLISVSTEVGTTFACGSLEVGSLPGVISVQSAVPHGFGVGAGSDRNTAPVSMRAGGSHPGGRRDWRRAS